MIEASEIRRRFHDFLGDERFQRFVREMPRLSVGTRLRYWQQTAWDDFVRQNPDSRLTYDELVSTLSICEVHGEELAERQVPVREGNVDYSDDYLKERRRYFPYAAWDFVSTEGRHAKEVSGTIWICHRCEEISQERNKKQSISHFLKRLDSIPWSQLKCQVGYADHVPKAVRDLLSNDLKTVEASYWRLENHVVVQGMLYEAAAYLPNILIEALDLAPHKGDILELLFQIGNGYSLETPDELRR